MDKKSRTSIGLAMVGICFFFLFTCFVLFYFDAFYYFIFCSFQFFIFTFSYARTLITLIERGDSNEDHCFYYDLTIILFCTFFIRVA